MINDRFSSAPVIPAGFATLRTLKGWTVEEMAVHCARQVLGASAPDDAIAHYATEVWVPLITVMEATPVLQSPGVRDRFAVVYAVLGVETP